MSINTSRASKDAILISENHHEKGLDYVNISKSSDDSELSLHQDNNIKIISAKDADVTVSFMNKYDHITPEISPEEEKSLSRKLVLIVVPLCALVNFVLYADKGTASYTSIFGMWKDTNMNQNRYNNSTTLFYVGYIVGQVNLILVQKFPIGYLLSILCFVWSLLIFMHTVATNYQTIYALRFLLGFVESIAVPILNITMGQFLNAKEKSWTASLFYITCLGNDIVLGFIAYGLLHVKATIRIWKLFMIVIGSISILTTIFVILIYPNNPTTAKFLSVKERVWVIRRVQKTTGSSIEQKVIKKHQAIEAIRDPVSWLFCAFFFCNQLSNNLVYQEKLLFKEIGVSTLGSTLVSVAYGGFAVICAVIAAFIIKLRNDFTAYSVIFWTIFPFIGSIAMITLPWDKTYALLAMIILCSTKGVTWILMFSWTSTTVSGYTKKVTRNAMIMIAYGIANIISPQLWQARNKPRYYPAWIVQLVFSFILGPIIAFSIRYVLAKRNNERLLLTTSSDELDYGYIKNEDEESATVHKQNIAALDLTDFENRRFIYPL
ncbi:uncharacterized transporter YLL055W [Kluyveromyces marxianus]|uniref:Uncharacterized transporter YLL055W n=2 Tax=Kluyveromyces marxianus TaxID=4911 RepID=W0T5X4_KLUMD|nr:uncharacterized protein KLMA_10831 [Kluyveromyces marxianus DMKU3-1042]QGN13374.1 putative transporter YLL055W [Kluyveromyces marxianus]BAO38453.1 uncharacterized transporter YLL055W [Kluyveromyces marxianus DMKU3-1042]BAP70004.1 uncharacterized transporter YLL055W [Kluyveromyces marxianus]